LFGGFLLLRQWGRIGWRGGRIKVEHYANAALAADALHRQAERKRRRG
jgi:predicted DNA-binding WGR domain protein